MQVTWGIRHVGRHRALPAIMLAALGGCTDAIGPALSAIIRVEADTIRAQQLQAGSVEWLRFVVPVSIENTSSVALAFEGCWYGVEQLDGGQWRRVWTPACAVTNANHVEVAPGGRWSVALRVDAATAGPGAPKWESEAITGSYRMTVGLVTRRRNIPSVTVVSDTFMLEVVKAP